MGSGIYRSVVSFLGILMVLCSLSLASDKAGPADLITKHLDSIGTSEVRTANTLRSGGGTATLDVISGGSGHMEGSSKVASLGKQFNFLMYFNAADYTGEHFKFDGEKALIGDNAVAERVTLAEFMYHHDVILKEGLWGGVWNSGWALYDLKGRAAELKYEGTKKVDGKQLLQYLYKPKQAEKELKVHLFFEPDTFRHVRTTYEAIGPTGGLPAVTVSESFSDYRDEKGLMLPHAWLIRYEPEQAGAYTVRWKVNIKDVSVTAANAPTPAQAAPKK